MNLRTIATLPFGLAALAISLAFPRNALADDDDAAESNEPVASPPPGPFVAPPPVVYAPVFDGTQPRYVRRARPPERSRFDYPAVPPMYRFSVHFVENWHVDDRYAVFATVRPNSGAGLTLARNLLRYGRLEIEAGFTWRNETSSGQFAQSNLTRLTTNQLAVEMSGRVNALDWLGFHVRLQGGALYHQYTFMTADGLYPLTGAGWTGLFAAGAGVTLRTPRNTFGLGAGRTVRLGLTLEGGYMHTSRVSLDVAPEPPYSPMPVSYITTAPLHLGELSASGGYFDVAASVLF